MKRATVAPMQCLARPSAALRSRLGVMYPEHNAPKSGALIGILDDIVKVDGLAMLLTEAIEKNMKAGSRLDERDVGAYVIRGMMKTMRGPSLVLVGNSANVEDEAVDKAAPAFGRLITKAIEQTQEKSGLTDMKKVAVYILRSMKEAKL